MPLKNSLKITFIEILNILILQINLIIYQKKKKLKNIGSHLLKTIGIDFTYNKKIYKHSFKD